ncbi:hypothetical protein FA95DRAFT_1558514 [Auriscalpium vulgare]|uniref:Uncharacterized protein n=1 Tax=Auriscalpium vulgare TaxID=40419 RepID=A0ACB8RVK3_9AGAM|nr:hypothetical protein FA95DRAFT_1558514 [Auriscalpium vulgare]
MSRLRIALLLFYTPVYSRSFFNDIDVAHHGQRILTSGPLLHSSGSAPSHSTAQRCILSAIVYENIQHTHCD